MSNQPGRAASVVPTSRPPQTPNQAAPQRPGPPEQGHARPQPAPQARPPPQNQGNQVSAAAPPAGAETVGFFSAKAVSQLPESSFQGDANTQLGAPRGQQLFNPKAESPSIRKTPGIDHTSSKPLARNGLHVSPNVSSSQSQPSHGNSGFTSVRASGAVPGPAGGARGNVINPNLDHTRRIGAPSGLGSPLGNRNSFRQPTMKRPPPGDANGPNGPRAALADLPANEAVKADVAGANGSEAKRPRMA
jgi:DNA repair and recombination protein RAD52